MSDHDPRHPSVRPRTAVLTRGFDPSLSLGSARPAVFRSSTYVFASPEAAEQAFAMVTAERKPLLGPCVSVFGFHQRYDGVTQI